jgi:hypothetical protein
MKRQTSLAVCGFAYVIAGLWPAASGLQIERSEYCESTMTRTASDAAGAARPRRILSPPGTPASSSSRLLGVDLTLTNLLEIDTTTGSGVVVGPVGDSAIGGLAYDPNQHILYGSSVINNVLLTIDPLTGATNVIGPFGVSLMQGLGYDSNNDVLYGITNQSSTGGLSLWRISVSTGAVSLVGAHSKTGLAGLAYDAASGTMYASEAFEGNLYTIDLSSGAVTLVGAFGAGVQVGVGLDFDASLGLFASDNKATTQPDDELYHIDTATGAATLVGPMNAGNVLGLAFEAGSIGTKYCTANPNSTGSPSDISASGSASSGAGDLTLDSAPVPNQNGIFFHGVNQSQNPFGNGFMCTTGGITRGDVIQATGNVATYTYDNSDAKHSLAAFVGTTRNFQHWFRDPMGGGAFFNLSNAISIAIQP